MRRVGEHEWREFPNFSRSEFDHGGPEMSYVFLSQLQTAREFSRSISDKIKNPEVRFIITSGSRSIERNRQVGGTPDSAHLSGCACDIKAFTSRERFIIVKSLMLAGFSRIGIYDTFIHVDNDPDKTANLLF